MEEKSRTPIITERKKEEERKEEEEEEKWRRRKKMSQRQRTFNEKKTNDPNQREFHLQEESTDY